MVKHPFQQLDVIKKVAASRRKVSDCYPLLYNKELYLYAYHTLKRNDLFIRKNSRNIHVHEWIDRYIYQLKNNTFQFDDEKSVKHRRNLYAVFKNSLLLEIIRMILLTIYQLPYFPSEINRYVVYINRRYKLKLNNWENVRWIIKGDGQLFVNKTDRKAVINILEEKIDDRRFLSFIYEALTVDGLMESKDLCKIPQAFLSPQLSSFFKQLVLRVFDNYMQSLMKENTTNVKYIRHLHYVYIGIAGSKREAENIKKQIIHFFQKEQQLEITRTELHLMNFSDKCSFLYVQLEKKWKHADQKRKDREALIQINVPNSAINILCSYYRYGSFHPFTINHRTSIVNLSERDILNVYNKELITIFSLYQHVSNRNILKKLYYMARSSFIKTIALKRKTTTTKVTKELKSFKQGYYSIVSYASNGKRVVTHFIRLQDLMRMNSF